MPDELDLRHYFEVIRRHSLLIVLAALIAGGAAFLVSAREQPRYRATSTILYTPQTSAFSTSEDPTRVLGTLANLGTNGVLMTRVATQLHTTEAALASSVSVSASATEDLIHISATDTVPARAADKANALTRVFLDWRANTEKASTKAQLAVLQKQLSDLVATGADASTIQALKSQIAALEAQIVQRTSDLSLVQAAPTPKQPYTPHTARNFAIGLLCGLLLGLLTAFVRERADRRLRNVEEIEQVYGRPALGLIPHIPAAARDRHAAMGDFAGSSSLVESYRTVRTNLALFRVGFENSPLKTIVVTSAMPGEGKSAVTANLAIALASSGRKVLAISADFRSPALHTYFSDVEGDGLLELLAGETTLKEAVRPVPLDGQIYSQTGGGLSLLANGRRFFDPVVLFESAGMAGALEEIKQRFDVVLFDAPPLLAASDASVLTQHADGLLIVAKLHSITRDQVRRVTRTLEAAEISPLGLIVTGIRDRDDAYGYGYEV
jgi:capsular exopolysaccharide synthesis family protein